MSSPPPSFDEIVWERVGAFGAYQKLCLFSRIVVSFSMTVIFVFVTLALIEPRWACGEGSTDFGHDCDVYANCTFDDLRFDSQFVSEIQEWRLICDKQYVPNFMVSAEQIGTLSGYLVAGPLSDKYGRRPVVTLGLAIAGLGCLANALVPSPVWFMVARIVVMFSFAGVYSSVGIWFMEQTNARNNVIMNAIEVLSWEYLFIGGGLAWVAGEWRRFLLYASPLFALSILSTIIFVEESPRWLVRNGCLERATRALNRIARINKKPDRLTTEEVEVLSATIQDQPKISYTLLFHAEYWKQTITLFICSATANFILSIVLFDLGNIGYSIYVDNSMVGVVRTAAFALVIFLSRYARSKFGLRLFVASYGSSFVAYGVLLLGQAADSACLTTIGVLSAFATSFYSYMALNQLVYEVYPTLMRSTAYAATYAVTCLAAMLVPQVIYLRHFWFAAPCVICMLCCLLSLVPGILTFSSAIHAQKNGEPAQERQPLLKERKPSYSSTSGSVWSGIF